MKKIICNLAGLAILSGSVWGMSDHPHNQQINQDKPVRVQENIAGHDKRLAKSDKKETAYKIFVKTIIKEAERKKQLAKELEYEKWFFEHEKQFFEAKKKEAEHKKQFTKSEKDESKLYRKIALYDKCIAEYGRRINNCDIGIAKRDKKLAVLGEEKVDAEKRHAEAKQRIAKAEENLRNMGWL